ncbi:MAG TPA: hypothetical protein DEA08_31275, partial [Planctomycetes bacterium]|nr:hypothetical protein [Planctomycetota bacterium]
MSAAITAAAANLPGSPTFAAWSERVLAARPAPLVELGPRWGVPAERYRATRPGEPGKTYLERAFGCELEVPPGADRQHALARDVVEQLLAERRAKGPLPARIGLIVATEWAGEAYFRADVRQALAELVPADALPPREDALAPDELLARLAEEAELAGPRLAIDTACASSLYALDVGSGWLAEGEADAVLVLGLTGFLPLFLFVGFSKLRALSPSGQLLPFARDAQGIVPGEGAGAVLLEPSDSPHAEARIVGLGLSCDGADRSVFAPAAEGQRRAYQAAYREVDPATVDVIEAHGTATPLGDEVELTTLDAFFAPHRQGRPLPLGSAKALVGHTLAAAGMASLLKVLAMLRAETLAPHVAVDPHPRLAQTCCELLSEARPWPRGERPRRAGVSSFGFGGSNAHLVIEEALAGPPASAQPPSLRGLVLSDLELALGSALDPAEVRRALREQRPLFSTFSSARFGRDRASWGAPEGAALGAYLPARFAVEGQALRLGPNLLARLDPLQQLTTELARRLLARQEVDPTATGVALVSNLGGDTALRLYRRSAYETRAPAPEPHQAAALGPDTTTEAIATSLTPMASGYPAFHFDLRAFHLTLSGEPGSLLDALALAPHWLARHA